MKIPILIVILCIILFPPADFVYQPHSKGPSLQGIHFGGMLMDPNKDVTSFSPSIVTIKLIDSPCLYDTQCSFPSVQEVLVLEMENYTRTFITPFMKPKTIFNLSFDKSVPHYSVSQTSANEFNISMKSVITDKVFYRRESTFPKQFKSVMDFYGTLKDRPTDSFIRGTGYIGCDQITLYVYMRLGNELYYMKPINDIKSSNTNNLALKNDKNKNLHEIKLISSTLNENDKIFTSKSAAIQYIFKYESCMKGYNDFSLEKPNKIDEIKYCLIHVIVDESFYRMMNMDYHKLISYVQQALVLANEIIQNASWKKIEYSSYSFAMHQIDIDLTFGNGTTKFTPDMLEKVFSRIDTDAREDSCLVYLFTSKEIYLHNKILSGFSKLNGIFSRDNVGATSVASCLSNLWNFKCLRAFAHELVHFMGATDDPEDDYNLKLSKRSIEQIMASTYSTFKSRFYVPAKGEYRLNTKCKFNLYFGTEWSKCGNSILEPGEQCDEGDTNMCCGPDCKLKVHAECSPYNSLCCTDKCQFSSNQTACTAWNYCPNKTHFCSKKRSYCSYENVVIDCEADESDLYLLPAIPTQSPRKVDKEKRGQKLWYMDLFAKLCYIFAASAIWYAWKRMITKLFLMDRRKYLALATSENLEIGLEEIILESDELIRSLEKNNKARELQEKKIHVKNGSNALVYVNSDTSLLDKTKFC